MFILKVEKREKNGNYQFFYNIYSIYSKVNNDVRQFHIHSNQLMNKKKHCSLTIRNSKGFHLEYMLHKSTIISSLFLVLQLLCYQ